MCFQKSFIPAIYKVSSLSAKICYPIASISWDAQTQQHDLFLRGLNKDHPWGLRTRTVHLDPLKICHCMIPPFSDGKILRPFLNWFSKHVSLVPSHRQYSTSLFYEDSVYWEKEKRKRKGNTELKEYIGKTDKIISLIHPCASHSHFRKVPCHKK